MNADSIIFEFFFEDDFDLANIVGAVISNQLIVL